MNKIFQTGLFIFWMHSCLAQYTFSSKVLDEQQQPVQGVIVYAEKNIHVAVTDSNGLFVFSYASKNFILRFSHVGFVPMAIRVNEQLQAVIVLSRNNELLQETIVKAFEKNSKLTNVAAAITVLNKNTLDRFGTASFVAAVNTVPGVKMDERSPGSYRLSIRGNLLRSTFGVRNVKVYWNGIPFTDANGNTYLNQLAVNNIGSIEIIKGPSGSMYGSGTGGVVLLSSVDAAALKKQWVNVQATAGSYGLISANAAYHKTGKNQTALSFSHQQSNGYRLHTNLRRDVISYTSSYQVSSKQRISANVFYSDLYYQTPGALTRAELQANPKQARPAVGIFKSAQTQKAAIYLKTLYAGLSHEGIINKSWNNTSSIYSSYTDFKNPTIRNYEKKKEQGLGGRTVFQYKHGFFTGTFGGEIQNGFFNTAVYDNKAGVRDTFRFSAAIQSRQVNVFAQTDIELPLQFLLNAGLSYNNFYYEYKKTSNVGAVKESSSFNPQFVPRISILKKIKTISVYAAVSKGYSVPTIDEVHAGNDIFNTALKPETAINYEAGCKGNVIKNKLWFDAAYYIFSLQNTIVNRRDAGGGDFYTNAGKTKQRGAELSVHYLPVNNMQGFIQQLKLSSSITSIKANFKNYQQGANKYDGNKLTGTPPNVFVIQADIVSSQKIYSNFSYSYTDHIPLNDANSFYAPSYQLLFAKCGYKTIIGKTTEINFYATAEKSFNNPFSLGNDLNAAGNRFFNPSAPQNFSVGIQCRFAVNN